MFSFWMFFIGMVVGALAAATIGEVWSMLIDDREDERAAAAARLSLLRRIPPEAYEEIRDYYMGKKETHIKCGIANIMTSKENCGSTAPQARAARHTQGPTQSTTRS